MVDLPRCSPFRSFKITRHEWLTLSPLSQPTEAMLFMDHRGSLFHEDLQNFQEFDVSIFSPFCETKLELIC